MGMLKNLTIIRCRSQSDDDSTQSDDMARRFTDVVRNLMDVVHDLLGNSFNLMICALI